MFAPSSQWLFKLRTYWNLVIASVIFRITIALSTTRLFGWGYQQAHAMYTTGFKWKRDYVWIQTDSDEPWSFEFIFYRNVYENEARFNKENFEFLLNLDRSPPPFQLMVT